MTARDQIADVSERLAAAISRRAVDEIRRLLAPDFVHRSHGGPASRADDFLDAIAQIPGEIVFVRLEAMQIDVAGEGALVTGIQHAQVRIEGQLIDDRRGFVDWFVKRDGEWRIQAAVDLPVPPDTPQA